MYPSDKTEPASGEFVKQTFYAVWDRLAFEGVSALPAAQKPEFPLQRGDLYEHEIIAQGELESADEDGGTFTDQENRVTSSPGDPVSGEPDDRKLFRWDYGVDDTLDAYHGWYLDLQDPNKRPRRASG